MAQGKGFWTVLEEVAPSTPERRIWRFTTTARDLAGVLRARDLPEVSDEFLMDLLERAPTECPDLPSVIEVDRSNGVLTFMPKNS